MKLQVALHSVESARINLAKAVRLLQLHASLRAVPDSDQNDDEVIKILMGPEFLWGDYAGAPINDSDWNYLNTEWGRISELFPHWLIIPGTAIWDHGNERRNLAPIYLNGELIHTYCKKNHTGEAGGKTWKIDYPTDLTPVPCGHHFEHRGVSFGIEICNDYRKGALLTETGGKTLDVHLLPSRSVQPINCDYYPQDKPSGARELVFDHAAVRPGGFLVNVDAAWAEDNEDILLNRKSTVYRRTSLRTNFKLAPPKKPDLRKMEVYGFWRAPDVRIINTTQKTPVVVYSNLDLEAPFGPPKYDGPGRRRSNAISL